MQNVKIEINEQHLADVIERKFKELFSEFFPKVITSGYLDKATACEYLSCNKKWLDNQMRNGLLTPFQAVEGGKQFFTKEQLDNLVKTYSDGEETKGVQS